MTDEETIYRRMHVSPLVRTRHERLRGEYRQSEGESGDSGRHCQGKGTGFRREPKSSRTASAKTEGLETQVQETLNGDDVSGWIAAHEGSKLYEHFSPEFQEKVTAEDIDKLLRRAWKKGETPVQISRLAADGTDTYVWSSEDGKMYLTAMLREGRIHGLLLRPSDPGPRMRSIRAMSTECRSKGSGRLPGEESTRC